MKTILLLALFFVHLLATQAQLTQEEVQTLKRQKYIIFLDKKNKQGSIVFDVNKQIDSVMQEILDLKNYPQKIEDISKVEIYEYSEKKIKARIFVSTFFLNFNNYVIHRVDKNNYTITWYLDESKENYFAKMQGSWKLQKVAGGTRVYYTNDLAFKNWIPAFLESYFFEKGLFLSTQWLKD